MVDAVLSFGKKSSIAEPAQTPSLSEDHPNKPIDRMLIRPNTPTSRKSTSKVWQYTVRLTEDHPMSQETTHVCIHPVNENNLALGECNTFFKCDRAQSGKSWQSVVPTRHLRRIHPNSSVLAMQKVEARSRKVNTLYHYVSSSNKRETKNDEVRSNVLSLRERQIASQVREYAYSLRVLSKASFEDPYRRDSLLAAANGGKVHFANKKNLTA